MNGGSRSRSKVTIHVDSKILPSPIATSVRVLLQQHCLRRFAQHYDVSLAWTESCQLKRRGGDISECQMERSAIRSEQGNERGKDSA